MNNTLNMASIFNSMDKRIEQADATIAKYTPAQVAEASRVASLSSIATSLKHKEKMAAILTA